MFLAIGKTVEKKKSSKIAIGDEVYSMNYRLAL